MHTCTWKVNAGFHDGCDSMGSGDNFDGCEGMGRGNMPTELWRGGGGLTTTGFSVLSVKIDAVVVSATLGVGGCTVLDVVLLVVMAVVSGPGEAVVNSPGLQHGSSPSWAARHAGCPPLIVVGMPCTACQQQQSQSMVAHV